VRQPRDESPQAAFDFIWSKTADLVFANGDAFVSIATRRGESSAIESMKAFDPVRYGPVDLPEDGLNWDAISQVGRLLKSENPRQPSERLRGRASLRRRVVRRRGTVVALPQ
jgi:hypothetical protein